MPKINTRYAAGPLDELVYRAAEAAGMPEVVISGHEEDAFIWRRQLSAWDSPELRDVVLHIEPQSPASFAVEVGVERSRHSVTPRRSNWQLVGDTSFAAVAEVDETWIEGQLRAAREEATRPGGTG